MAGTDFERGRTMMGQQGFVAWIEDDSREVMVAKGKCLHTSATDATIDIEDETLTVPHGRLQSSQEAALDQLAFDLRRLADERASELWHEWSRSFSVALATMNQPVQKIADVNRDLMNDLVAVEMAKQCEPLLKECVSRALRGVQDRIHGMADVEVRLARQLIEFQARSELREAWSTKGVLGVARLLFNWMFRRG